MEKKTAKQQRATVLGRASRSGRATEDEKLLDTREPGEQDFVRTDPWRVMRITGEFVEGIDALAEIGPAVTIFGSARVDESDPIYQQGVEIARLLGEAGFAIITGGGPGIMEAGNRGARMAGAKSIGLNIELPFEQRVNSYVDIPVEFRYFFVRKTMFVKYGSAFVILPGGFGTLDELFESLVLIQTGKLRCFPVILFGSDYWRGLLDWFKTSLLPSGKIAPADLNLLILSDSPTEVRDIILRSAKETDSVDHEEQARDETQRVYTSDLR